MSHWSHSLDQTVNIAAKLPVLGHRRPHPHATERRQSSKKGQRSFGLQEAKVKTAETYLSGP